MDRIACFIAVLLTVINAHAAAEIKPERIREVAASLPAHAVGCGQPASNREAWDKIAALPSFQQFLHSAEAQRTKPLENISDELYLEFSRNGNRTHWQNAEFERRNLLDTLTLAECLENKGRFLPPLEAIIKAICAERTWVYPAHDGSLKNFKGTTIDIDLGASTVAWQLATLDYLLGDKLSAPTRALIRENLQRRIFKPYHDAAEGRASEIHWMRGPHNWNAVCHSGVLGAALAMLDSREERAWFILASEFYLKNFLRGFGGDGYCSEGLGYWNYGFGRYVLIAEAVRQATGGKVDWLADQAAQRAALFGQRAEIINDIYPSIADCHPGSRPDAFVTTFLARRLNLTPDKNTQENVVRPHGDLFRTALFSFLPDNLPRIADSLQVTESPLRTWFSEGGVLICRPAPDATVPFAVSLKGGNNAEHHNHNDVGTFIVVAGNSMVLVDPGAEVYTARTFGSHRYDSDVLNSFGHDVPVISGKLQRAGAEARGRVVSTNFTDAEDSLTLDISSAYTVTNLTKLQRTFVYHRAGTPSLTVQDEVGFKAPDSYETALVTWGAWKQTSPTELLFGEGTEAVRVKIDTGKVPFKVSSKKLEADVPTPKATRIGLHLEKPVSRATVTMTITPEMSQARK
jgi:hypothetical protein